MADPVCAAFQPNGDGTWTSTRPVTIQVPTGELQIGPGQTFRRGIQFMGLDVATWLDMNCRPIGPSRRRGAS